MNNQEVEYYPNKNNSNELSLLFDKFPNWSRWILALPFAYLGWIAARYAFNWSYARFVGWFAESIELLFESTGGIIAFIYVFYSVIPKKKFLITLILSIILGTLYIISGTLLISSGEYLMNSLLFTIFVYGLTIFTISMTCVAIYKDQKNKQNEHSQ